ncbi:MAG TPA: hypothetical protein VJ831_05275 [Jatrophihabitantaceae bacterium]|nr:hypothetical protein [Jatrophihabitantaceae bacterium]
MIAGLAATALAGSLAVAPAASAAILPTTTTVTASPATSVAGDAVTLTARVYLKPVGGLIITPSGFVNFTASNGTTTTPLGQARLGRCLLSACFASITTTGIPAGSTVARAAYAGDLVAGKSSGSTPITVTVPLPPPADGSTTETCAPDQSCSTETISSADGNTELTIDAPPAPDGQTVTASLDSNGVLNCPGDVDPHLGALATFETTSATGELIVHYVGHGDVAAQMEANYAAHTVYMGCFGSPTPFDGWVGGSPGPAQFVAADGLYEAQLSNCTNVGNVPPCATNINAATYDEYEVHTGTPGDPKIIG